MVLCLGQGHRPTPHPALGQKGLFIKLIWWVWAEELKWEWLMRLTGLVHSVCFKRKVAELVSQKSFDMEFKVGDFCFLDEISQCIWRKLDQLVTVHGWTQDCKLYQNCEASNLIYRNLGPGWKVGESFDSRWNFLGHGSIVSCATSHASSRLLGF